MNLGTLSLILFIFVIKIFVLTFIFWPLSKKFGIVKTKFLDLKKEMIFNSFFGLLFEGFFNIILCCFFNLSAPNEDIDKNNTNLTLDIVLMASLLIILPIALIYIAI